MIRSMWNESVQDLTEKRDYKVIQVRAYIYQARVLDTASHNTSSQSMNYWINFAICKAFVRFCKANFIQKYKNPKLMKIV